ncbi:hypothetical protein [Vibrio owensii]|uniref:hypothetical protein n=1 Tax=Vibrio owensii TaxID=696485 RepID=UPI003CE532A4
MNTDLDQVLLSGDEEALSGVLDEMDLDGGFFLGDEEEAEATTIDEQQQTNVAEQSQALVDNSNMPEVIDTTGQIDEALGGGNQQTDDQPSESQDKAGFKEIDGQLYVAVNADNAEVSSKNGKHSIPYEALQRPREQVQELNTKVAELEQQLGAAKTAEERNALLTKQLEEAGITPERLPDELLQDPNAMQTIIDEIDGPAGQLIAAMFSKIQSSTQPNVQQPQQQQQAQQQANTNDPLNAPELSELKGWMDSDPDRWDTAVIIDRSLSRDPQFASLTDGERFAEVQRRVKASFGDPVVESAMQEQQEANANPQQQQQTNQPSQNQVPNSPSSLAGGNVDTKQAAQQAMLNQDPMALEAAMESMSEADIDALLMQAGDSL